MKNRYCVRSHISENKFRRMLKGYVTDHTAQELAGELHLNINSVDRYFRLFRERIVLLTGINPENHAYRGQSDVEFADHLLIGLRQNQKQVVAEIVAPKHYHTFTGPLSHQDPLEDIINRADWPDYDELIDVRRDRRFTIRETNVSGFWDFAHLRLAKFRGMHKSTFLLHLKECEWRYNNRDRDLYAILLTEFRNYPLGGDRPSSAIN